MVAKLPVLQNPNAIFTLCIHRKSVTKHSRAVLLFFFFVGGKKKRNFPITIKGYVTTDFHLTLHFFQFPDPRQARAFSTTNWLFFLYFPVSEQTLTFIPVKKRNTYFERLRAEQRGNSYCFYSVTFLQMCKKAAFH